MLTPDELRTLPLFAKAPQEALEGLASVAADIHLAIGEYAANEGDERALFVVISGQIQVSKKIDGIARPIGLRAPGQIFGEIPIIFGVPFQGSFHAKVPSRVVRVAQRDFYALAIAVPEVLVQVGEEARDRIGGLKGIATAPRKARATILSEKWDPAGHELRDFLGRNEISFDWLTPDARELSAHWPGTPPAELPAVSCEDGAVLIRPRLRQLAERLGLPTTPGAADYDTIVVGGGPAGLAAAVYGASEGLRTLVIEREAPGGQAGTSSRIENYLGFPTGVSGGELAGRALQQARRLGAELLVTRNVVGIDPIARTVRLDGGEAAGEALRARTIVIATGVSWRRLKVEGFDRLLGKGVFYGAARSEIATTQGQDIHLVGAGNSAGQAALAFANHARQVTLVVRGDSLAKSMSHYLLAQLRGKANIGVELRTEVQAVQGQQSLDAVDLVDRASGAVTRQASAGVFVFIGADAETSWLPDQIARDARGYVMTGEDVARAGRWAGKRDPYILETSVPGVFAVGDVRASPVKRVAAAVGEGSMAIAFIHQYLQETAAAG